MYKYNHIYTAKDGTQYNLWAERDDYGWHKYGWNVWCFGNWYDDTTGGYWTAAERDQGFRRLLRGEEV